MGGVAQDPGRDAGLVCGLEKESAGFVAEQPQGPQRWRIPGWSLSCLLFPVSGRTDEAEGLPSTAHQLHAQNCENHQVPRLGVCLPGATPAYPGPGARCPEDLRLPLLCVSRVLPSVYISGDVILGSLQMPEGWERTCLGWRAGASSIASHGPQRHLSGLCPPGTGSRLSATLVPQQVALVVFAVHTLVAEDNAMDAEKAFVTLTVLGILNKAQAFLPFSVHCLVQVRVQEGPGVITPAHCQQRRGGRGLEDSPTSEVRETSANILENVSLLQSGTHPGPLLERGGTFFSLPFVFADSYPGTC